ncbi:MAG: NAD(P)/FAD-dependent oxidoreductase, partial [Micromonosporaceae bacterium]
MSTSADLMVVGGGAAGCFTAYLAARSHPDWRVVLTERGSIAGGATGWSAGVFFPLAATAAHRELVRASATGYAALRGTAAAPLIRPIRMLYVPPRGGESEFRRRVVDAPVRPASAAEHDQVARMLPELRMTGDEQLLTHDGGGFVVRARPLAETLLAEVADRVEVRQHRVTALRHGPEGYRVSHAGGTELARRVVLATGPWPPPPVHPVPLPEPPTARRKRVTALHASLPVRADDPLVYFLGDDLFVLPLADREALVSFYRDEWDTDPETADGRLSEADRRAGLAVLERRSAPAAEAVTGGRAFCDLYT